MEAVASVTIMPGTMPSIENDLVKEIMVMDESPWRKLTRGRT